MKLYQKLKLLREEKGITQDTLVKETGLSPQAIRNYENPDLDRLPNTVQLKILKDYFDVTYEYLLDDECENKTNESVDIGKKLKLSDEALNRIMDLQNHDRTYYPQEHIYDLPRVHTESAFNTWLSNFENFKRFCIRLDFFYNLNQIMESTRYFIDLLKFKDQIIKSVETDKKFVTKLINLLDSKMNIYAKCLEVEDKIDFINNSFYKFEQTYSQLIKYCNGPLNEEYSIFLILDDISTCASIIYEDAYRNSRYCQYEICELIKESLSISSKQYEKYTIPNEIQNLLNQIERGENNECNGTC